MAVKIVGTGLSGLVGSRVVEQLSSDYVFTNISRQTGVNITNREQVIKKISEENPDFVFHFAAKTDVDGCEQDKEKKEEGEAWKLNVLGTRHVVEACSAIGKPLLYISTDFVFSGEDTPDSGYDEEDPQNPVNWYGQTKYEAEKLITQVSSSWTILRIAYPYRALFPKIDFMRKMKELLEKKQTVRVVVDHLFCPTFIDDISRAIDVLLKNNAHGIFHICAPQPISPYQGALSIAKEFGFDASLIEKTTREEFFKGRAPRPFNISLKSAKIQKLGIRMKAFEEGLKEVKTQIAKIKTL